MLIIFINLRPKNYENYLSLFRLFLSAINKCTLKWKKRLIKYNNMYLPAFALMY